jgi:DNA repair photolyase
LQASHLLSGEIMIVREIEAKTLLSSATQPDPWFGIKYTMNLYRGCQHHCIYCDSRSECYGIADFDGEVLVKVNALDLLRRELPRKRVKGYISAGSMNDPYMPLERERRLTAQALAVIAECGFPVHILTKSDLALRDVETFLAIEAAAGGPSPGAVISFTVTTADDDLARKIEPAAPPPSARLAALAALAARGLHTGIVLMPVLPFLTDSPENIRQIVAAGHKSGARHVIPAFGVTLRDRQRAYFYRQLDQLFPDLRPRYERTFGGRYHAPAAATARLETVFAELAATYGLARNVAAYQPAVAQLPLL